MKKQLFVISIIAITISVIIPLIYFYALEPAGIAKEVGSIISLLSFGIIAISSIVINYKKKT